jgi:transposase
VNEVKFSRKINRLLKRIGLPRFLHHFGPKLYEFADHVLALLIRESCKLSYRAVNRLLRGLGFNCPSYSALAKMFSRVPLRLWNALFAATIRFKRTVVAAFDGTFYARSNPSFHYLKRIKRKPPLKRAVQVNALFDTRRKKWLALSTRLKRVHETRDVVRVVKRSPTRIRILTFDKAGDCEETHRLLERECGVEPHIPVRRGVHRGFYRRKHAAFFRTRTYHRRELIESGFSRIKRTQGQAVKNRLARTIHREIVLKFLNDNLALLAKFFENPRLFQQSRNACD